MNPSIQGVTVAAVTPHRNRGDEVDVASLLDLIDFLSEAGVQAIALLGSTGEFLHFKAEDRIRLVYMAVKRSRVPIVVGVSHSTLDGAVELGREAISAGAAALLVMPPYFFRYEQDDIREFYLRFAAQVGTGAGTLLYNIPAFTSPITTDTAGQLLSTGLFLGIKDSSGDIDYFRRLNALSDRSRFDLLIGHDRVFAAARQRGANGVVSGIASAVPELLLGLERAIERGDTARTEVLDRRVQEFITWIGRFPTPLAVKVAVSERGIKVGPSAFPLSPATKRGVEEFREWFRAWLPVVQKESENV